MQFQFAHDYDVILEIMRRTRTFFEAPVLEVLRSYLERAPAGGLIVDVGAFVGTHAVFFALFGGARAVAAFEADPDTFALLTRNVVNNGVGDRVLCLNVALGSTQGMGALLRVDPSQPMKNRVGISSKDETDLIEIAPLDQALTSWRNQVRLIKIDAEGKELDILRGATETIAASLPILCVEVLSFRHLRRSLRLLNRFGYTIVDCLGHGSVPMYLFEARRTSRSHRRVSSLLWLIRAAIPRRLWPFPLIRGSREWLSRIASSCAKR